jgi:cytidylate kinase
MNTTIAITRQMGSAGSYLGQLIADRLGIRYVDREVLYLAAQELGIEPLELNARAERLSSFWQNTLRGLSFSVDAHYTPPPLRLFTDKELFDKQTEIMKEIANKNDCVIVGWGGAHVLPRHRKMITIFCHAPIAYRIERVIKVYKACDKVTAQTMIIESDEMRKNYIAQMTGKDWACAENYDLTFDTGLLSLEKIAELLIEIIKLKGIMTGC